MSTGNQEEFFYQWGGGRGYNEGITRTPHYLSFVLQGEVKMMMVEELGTRLQQWNSLAKIELRKKKPEKSPHEKSP